jgi:hypothetical protein
VRKADWGGLKQRGRRLVSNLERASMPGAEGILVKPPRGDWVRNAKLFMIFSKTVASTECEHAARTVQNDKRSRNCSSTDSVQAFRSGSCARRGSGRRRPCVRGVDSVGVALLQCVLFMIEVVRDLGSRRAAWR